MNILDRVKSAFQRPAMVEIFNRTDGDLTVRAADGSTSIVTPRNSAKVELQSGMRISVGDESVKVQKPPFPAEGGMSIN